MTGASNTYGDFRSNKFHGVDFSLRHNSGVAIMEELGYSPEPLRQTGYAGDFKLGGLYDSEPRLQFDTGKMRGGTWEVYLTGQQRLHASPGGRNQSPSGTMGISRVDLCPSGDEHTGVFRGCRPVIFRPDSESAQR